MNTLNTELKEKLSALLEEHGNIMAARLNTQSALCEYLDELCSETVKKVMLVAQRYAVDQQVEMTHTLLKVLREHTSDTRRALELLNQ